MTSTPLHVAYVTDATYLPWCATSILSCLQSTDDQAVSVHVLHPGDLSASDQARLRDMVTAHGGQIDFRLVDLGLLQAFPSKGAAEGERISWARLLIPDALADLDRVIYLDGDTLTLGSLQTLWETALTPHPIGAVSNVVEPAMRDHVAELGVEGTGAYFNAGVLVMDLKSMRSQGLLASALLLAGDGTDLRWFDQDALNVVFARRWHRLPPAVNAQYSFWLWHSWAEQIFGQAALQEAVRSPLVLHFEGPVVCKPWHFLCPHPFADRYRSVLAQTPWRATALEDRTVATRLIRHLPANWRIPLYARLLHLRARRHRGQPSGTL